MSKQHTPGPWSIGKISHAKQRIDIDALSGDPALEYSKWEGMVRVYGCDENKAVGSKAMEANARRIVACVNACAGIPTEWLEDSTDQPALNDKVAALVKQRDELLAALEMVLSADKADAWRYPTVWGPIMDKARATFSSVEGGAA